MYTKIALTIAVTVITTKLVLHIEEQRKIRNLHNSINKLIDSKELLTIRYILDVWKLQLDNLVGDKQIHRILTYQDYQYNFLLFL